MIKTLKILLITVLLSGNIFAGKAQNQSINNKPVLFVDRDYCVSGDTVWFKVFMMENPEEFGNIIRVQLDNKYGDLIVGVAVKLQMNRADGYIYVPDSLSTGQYFITAFLHSQKNIPNLKHLSKSLLVYNRFDENIHSLEISISDSKNTELVSNSLLSINTDKEEYNTRENVEVNLNFKSNKAINNAIIRASLIDPLANEISGQYTNVAKNTSDINLSIIEKDGFLLKGKVTDETGNLQNGVLVILSIGVEPPYFDYYFTGENGEFYFYLQNAFGKIRVVLQVVSENSKKYFIQLQNNSLSLQKDYQTELKKLTIEQTDFIYTAIQSSFVNKLFHPVPQILSSNFDFPQKFQVPFYGTKSERVIPSEFYELKSFEEISREILPGVQYREKENEISIRLVNNSQRRIFENEPLRLLNGIPVFNNQLLAELKTEEIDYIDFVKEERIFGDLVLKGVLSVMLYDKTNTWLARQTNVYQFDIDMIQQYKSPAYYGKITKNKTSPDIRQVFLWNSFEKDLPGEFNFDLSDRKGKVEIEISGYTIDNEFFKSSKIITVR